MNDLTREQIEDVREKGRCLDTMPNHDRVCDMALRTLDAEAHIRELEAALREARKSLPPDPSLDAPWSRAIAIIDEALTKAPPDSEPAGRPVRPHRSGGGLPPEEPEGPSHVPYYLPDSEPAEGEGDDCKRMVYRAWGHKLHGPPDATPSQRRDALEELDSLWDAAGQDLLDPKYQRIRRALSAGVPDSAYQSAVQGRREFREALRQERGKLKTVRRLPEKWQHEWASSMTRDKESVAYLRGKKAAGDELDRALVQSEQGRGACAWHDNGDFWEAECGGVAWDFTDGGEPHEHGMKYCFSCGRPLAAAPQPQEGKSDE